MGALQLLSVCVCVCVCFFIFLIYVSTQELFLHCCASCGDVASVISITISVIEKALRLFYITALVMRASDKTPHLTSSEFLKKNKNNLKNRGL